MNTFVFLWREVSLAEATRAIWNQSMCRLLGHRWHKHSWYESWDVGAGYYVYWWMCTRCEKFSHEDPA